jgi:hypothetical protein
VAEWTWEWIPAILFLFISMMIWGALFMWGNIVRGFAEVWFKFKGKNLPPRVCDEHGAIKLWPLWRKDG